jgi:hypothetical protein
MGATTQEGNNARVYQAQQEGKEMITKERIAELRKFEFATRQEGILKTSCNSIYTEVSRTALPEALDEIERLRGVLQRIVEYKHRRACLDTWHDIITIAQSALAGESAPCE